MSLPTVENLANIGVFFPIVSKIFALQYLVMSCVTTKYPCAPIEANLQIVCEPTVGFGH